MSYQTTELELASFLRALGKPLLSIRPEGRLVSFVFDCDPAEIEPYFAGVAIPARDLFEAHRHLRTLIQQVKQHSNQQIRSEKPYEKHESGQFI